MNTLPTPDEIRAFISRFVERGEGPPTRRDIAKEFGLKGPNRAELRRLLNTMADSGSVALAGKRTSVVGQLPPVMLVDAIEIDNHGDLLCEPTKSPDHVDTPPMRLPSAIAGRTKPPIGVGTRFLSRLSPGEAGELILAPIKVLGKGVSRTLGVYTAQRRGGVVETVAKKRSERFEIAPSDVAKAKDGDLVWVEARNQRGYGPKSARVVEVIGDIAESRNWSLIALAEQEIPITFTEDVVKEANNVTMPDGQYHEDRRDLPLITIDPADAKDHDDAVFATFDETGFTVTVAIADVSWFVRRHTALDGEAERRGNSVYLVDRVVPMLPEVLSNGLCSLKAGEDRPALICEMRMDLEGRKKSHIFRRAIIRSKAGISYEEAQAAADGLPNARTRPIKETIIDPLYAAYHAMAKAKASNPSLELDLPERKIVLGNDGQVETIRMKDRLDAHKLVETMMVAANVCAAETLEQTKRTVIYRVHETPNAERIDTLREYLDSQGYSLPKGQALTPLSFNRILAKAAERDEIEAISMAILRAQSQAVYDTSNVGHFGLNLPRYAHFTSPIRRYADLTVHRGLVAAITLGPGGSTTEDEARLENVAEAISLTERRAIGAERSTQDRFLAAYLEPQIGNVFQGRITGTTRAGLFVALNETGADGFIPARTLRDDYYFYEEDAQAMIGRNSRAAYRNGQRVDVTLLEVTPLKGGMRFEMITDPVPLNDANSKRRKPAGRRNGVKPSGFKAKKHTVPKNKAPTNPSPDKTESALKKHAPTRTKKAKKIATNTRTSDQPVVALPHGIIRRKPRKPRTK